MITFIRNIKLVIAYDGSGFMGWQIQPNVRTLQETVEKALEVILGHETRVVASGRTDAGVHALGQVINFHTNSTIPLDGLIRGLNSILPGDISVISAQDVEPDFNSRFKAKKKNYAYVIDMQTVRSPFLERYAYHEKYLLDIQAMQKAAEYLLGEHDFSSFLASGSSIKTTVREITRSEVITHGDKVIFWIQGSGFLRYMVRNIVGTLLLVGRGRLAPEKMESIIALKDRDCAGPTAPPQGLYLIGVEY